MHHAFGRDRIAVADLEAGFGTVFLPAIPERPSILAYKARRRAERQPAGAEAVEA